jgi:glycine/D-amino acid oxidase-like deaminating enzyme/nitrite reductase/ring-hydroxylating ferredoxin subunit
MSRTSQLPWPASVRQPRPALGMDVTCDIAIIGAGIVGLTLAHRLRGVGTVCLFEGRLAGQQATARSTAKVTAQHHLIYDRLIRDIGAPAAKAYADCNQAAIGWFRTMAEGDDSIFRQDQALAYATSRTERRKIEREAKAAGSLGLPAHLVDAVDLPFATEGAVAFDAQGAIDPLAFCERLIERLPDNATLYENARIERVEYGDTSTLHTKGHRVRARWVVVATQIPTIVEGHYFAKAFPQAHVVLAGPAPDALPHGMFISAGSPSRSFRRVSSPDGDFVLATGKSFKPGDARAQAKAEDDLAGFLDDELGTRSITHRWVNEDFTPMDNLPFVGSVANNKPRLLVATGFNAWGLTTGVVAADILAATIRAQDHPLSDVLRADRLRPTRSAGRFTMENARSGLRLVGDRIRTLRRGGEVPERQDEGCVMRHEGRLVALSRDRTGQLRAVSAICTHMGCVVHWNDIDRTWDCPCHGSRFDGGGRVLTGPATKPLEPVAIDAAALQAHVEEER